MFNKIRAHASALRRSTGDEEPLRCSFCSKEQADVRKLIAGPSVFICDECVAVCNDIIADDTRFENRHQAPAPEAGNEALGPGVQVARVEPADPSSSHLVACFICRMTVPLDDTLFFEGRGPVCLGCAEKIEAALAARREGTES